MVAMLDDSTAGELLALQTGARAGSRDASAHLSRRCAELARQGWPKAAIARALNVSRSRVRELVDRVDPDTLPPAPPRPEKHPTTNPYGFKRRMAQEVPKDAIRKINRLAPVARELTGTRKPSHPSWQASRDLNALLYELYHQQNVASTAIMRAFDPPVTHRTVMRRVQAHERLLENEGMAEEAMA